MMKRVEATVRGYVQGVSFRYYAILEADRLRLRGWIANHRDGTVRVVAEGSEEALHAYVDWLHGGSPAARVASVDVQWGEATGQFEDFEVRWL